MGKNIDINAIYAVSEDVVAREIEGEIIIVPLVAGIGDMEDELYTLNETGQAIWKKLNGKKPLRDIIEELAAEYEAAEDVIQGDVTGLLDELLRRKMIAKVD
jgi:hypothetical protein